MSDQNGPLDDLTRVNPMTPSESELAVAPPLTPMPVAPVGATATGPRTSRGRWAAAIAVSALIVVVTAGIVAALVGRSPDAVVMGYVPSGAVAYAEVRLDLPGDQRQAVGEFLSHFPGFADQSTLDNKLDEVLDDLVKDATDGSQTFTADIKPWFGGEIAASAGPLPSPADIGDALKGRGLGDGLVLVSIKDATAADAWFDAAFARKGATPTAQDYAGTSISVFNDKDGDARKAFAIVDGKVALAGSLDAVKAAIDTGGKGGFASDPDVRKALGSAPGDHIGFAYLGLGEVLEWADRLGASLPGGASGSATPGISGPIRGLVPAWGALWLRVEPDAVVLEATAAKTESSLGPTTDRSSDIARHVPASTIALAVSHDTGKTLGDILDLYGDQGPLKDVAGQIKQGLGGLGGADQALGWIGDTGIVVAPSGDAVEGGLVILPTDAKAAGAFFTSVRNLASLGGIAGITFSDQDHGGTTITVVTIDLPGPAHQLTGLPLDKVELAWAVTDDLVVIGSGPSFVGHVLDTTEATSLAGTDRYRDLMARVGQGTGSLFVDITAARAAIERVASRANGDALKDYETDLKPFLAPLDALVASRSVGGDVDRSTVIITVK